MAQDLAAPDAGPIIVAVETQGDVHRARQAAVRLASAIGFAGDTSEQIGLAVMELGTNLLRHASRGTLSLAQAPTESGQGIQVETEDAGPGIADIEQAITDGFSTAGSLGFGLGTVNRVMDELDIHPSARGGVHIVGRRWVRSVASPGFHQKLEFGVATRPRRWGEENGDAFLVKQWNGYALAGVIDGLGHGPLAHRAAQAARQYLEAHFDQPLERLFRGAGRACRATRGVVMALAQFDLAPHRVRVASVGNIEVRLLGASKRPNLTVRRGVIGMNAPEAHVTEHPWEPGNRLVMHSDGVSTQWNSSELEERANEPLVKVARHLLQTFGKADDDATVLVVGEASS